MTRRSWWEAQPDRGPLVWYRWTFRNAEGVGAEHVKGDPQVWATDRSTPPSDYTYTIIDAPADRTVYALSAGAMRHVWRVPEDY